MRILKALSPNELANIIRKHCLEENRIPNSPETTFSIVYGIENNELAAVAVLIENSTSTGAR